MNIDADVIIIGAGPSGTIAGAILANKGHSVKIFERRHFPRFSIGESLLPQCMVFIEEAGMLDAVQRAGFQLKNGAQFEYGGQRAVFNFSEKYTLGWATTFQVQRADFDKILADEAEKAGVEIYYGTEIKNVEFAPEAQTIHTVSSSETETETETKYHSQFILDASGFGRVLPRLLNLETPSGFPVRHSMFTHIEDNIVSDNFDRNKILVSIHPRHTDVWFWLIPFGNGRSSIGVVAEEKYFEQYQGSPEDILRQTVVENPEFDKILKNAIYDSNINQLSGYSANVKSLWGNGYALLGNAGEFLDPVFSSGVTIAMKSASLAAGLLDRQLHGEVVDWETQFSQPLKIGTDTFRAYVDAWYAGKLIDIFFYHTQSPKIKNMICSVLAGYAWDTSNSYVKHSRKKLDFLAELCAAS